jgi:2',3'-cyclic-nucleotide 2'-phosphodiesterase (5'-nucleotidase family)
MRLALPSLLTLALLGAGCVEFNAECSPPIDDPDEVVTHLAAAIPVERTVVRTRENALGNAMADAYLKALQAGTGPRPDVAVENAGAIRDLGLCITRTALAKGPLTRRVLKDTVPFSNRLVMVTLTERELFDVLEHAVATVSIPGTNPSGQFLHVSGFSFEADCTRPPEKLSNGPSGLVRDQAGSRVTKVTFAGRVITRESAGAAPVVVALNDFLAGGGDNFLDFKGKEVVPSSPERYTFNAVEDYLKGLGATSESPASLVADPAAPRIVLRNCN